ncbi:hypothetical protein ACT048_20705 [Ectopseudomonas khazarica]|uniref:hypothetical protein n=1 Tax=Ectopseudomonas khazarica TaxID=2502979 RepID=UPI004034F00B
MLLFGRTLFGGSAQVGVITAAGLAACAVAAFGEAQVQYQGGASVTAPASATGAALRLVLPGGEGLVTAMAGGQALAHFLGSGHCEVLAAATGKPWAQFFGAAQLQAGAELQGTLYRRIRMRWQPPAKAFGYAEADGAIYAYAYGRQARARATALGTTYQLTAGTGTAHAEAVGAPVWIIGARQDGRANASASAAPVLLAGAAGQGLARAEGMADAAQTQGGVRYHTTTGRALAQGLGALSHVSVYQAQRLYAHAYLVASAVQTRGARGSAASLALAAGEAVIIQTGVEGQPAGVRALASADAIRTVMGGVQGLATAVSSGWSTMFGNGWGSAASQALGNTSGVAFGVTGHADGVARAEAEGVRVHIPTPLVAACLASASGFNQINDLTRAPPGRTVQVLPSSRSMRLARADRTLTVS